MHNSCKITPGVTWIHLVCICKFVLRLREREREREERVDLVVPWLGFELRWIDICHNSSHNQRLAICTIKMEITLNTINTNILQLKVMCKKSTWKKSTWIWWWDNEDLNS